MTFIRIVVLTLLILPAQVIPLKAASERDFAIIYELLMRFHKLKEEDKQRFLFLLDRSYMHLLADILNMRDLHNAHTRFAEKLDDGR